MLWAGLPSHLTDRRSPIKRGRVTYPLELAVFHADLWSQGVARSGDQSTTAIRFWPAVAYNE